MSSKKAYRRYISVLIPSMLVYVMSVFMVVHLIKSDAVGAPLSYALALIPGLAALTFMGAHFRFIRETDEFHRKVQTEGMMIGIAVVLSVAMTLGMVGMFTDFPQIPFFYAIPIFYIGYGLGCAYLSRKYKTSCSILL